jgi:ribose-phosphate pyrophosphokinase
MTIRFQSKHKSGFTVDSPFTAFTFPAGEAHLKVPENYNPADYLYHIADVRGHDPQDLFHLAMWRDAILSWDDEHPDIDHVTPAYVILPYLPGARADRGIPVGALIYADFINSLEADRVITIDPHSPFMVNQVWNSTVFPFERIIKNEIQDVESDTKPQTYVGVIAPDKGAVERATRAAAVMGVPVYLAGKTRDFETGKLTGFHMEDSLPAEGKFLLVDDICDGGGTFVGLAEAIKETNPDVELDLWVTHGVLSQGMVKLNDHFGTIHTTNSYFGAGKGLEYGALQHRGELVVHDVTPYLYGEIPTNE